MGSDSVAFCHGFGKNFPHFCVTGSPVSSDGPWRHGHEVSCSHGLWIMCFRTRARSSGASALGISAQTTASN